MTKEQAPAPTDPRFYTLKEAAEILRVNPSTLSRQCAAGTFPHVRVGRTVRIPVAEVERLERGEPQRASVMDVPDYVTGTPSMFDVPEHPGDGVQSCRDCDEDLAEDAWTIAPDGHAEQACENGHWNTMRLERGL